MTTNTNDLQEVRKNFLDAVNDSQSDTTLLRELLKDFKSSTPGLLVAHDAEDEHGAIDPAPSNWNEQYFSMQKKIAEKHFSQERVEHLLQIRERFRKEGRKGFVPRAEAAAAAPRPEADSSYNPSHNLRKFVDEGKLPTIRTALTIELEDVSLDTRTLRAAMAWTRARVPGLFEPYAEKAFARAIERNRELWTADYYGTQAVYLDTNFAEERFLHLVEVREHLRQQTAAGPEKASAQPSPSGPAATPRPAPKPGGAQPRASQQPHRAATPPSRPGLSPAMTAALLVGGALVAVVIIILAMRN